MPDILIFLTDPDTRADVSNLFQDEPHTLILAEELDAVVDTCRREIIDLLLIWPATVEITANVATLLAGHQFGYIPLVPVLPAGTPAADFYHLPVAEVIQTPTPREIFRKILQNALQDLRSEATLGGDAHWEGSLAEYNLVDLIQMIELSARDAELKLKFDDIAGTIYFQQGQVIDARLGKLEGLAALKKLAAWQRGHFRARLITLEEHRTTIEEQNQDLLVMLVEYLLKMETLLEGLPRLYEPVMANPLVKLPKPTPLQKRILAVCRHPRTIFAVLSALEDQNEDLLLELNLLFQNGNIGRKNEVEAQIRAAEEQSGLDKLITSVSSLFKKKGEPPIYISDFRPEVPRERSLPRNAGTPEPLSPEEIRIITEKLEAIFR